MKSLLNLFAELPDPRQQGKVRHKLAEMLTVAVAAILCGADNCTEIQDWGEARLPWLRKYIPLEHGIASHDTYSTVLALIDAQAFSRCFMQWAVQLLPAFVRADRRTHLNAVAAVDMHFAFVIDPRHAKLNQALRFNHAREQPLRLIAGVGLDKCLQR